MLFMLHKIFFLENSQLLFGMLCKARKVVLTKPGGRWVPHPSAALGLWL